MKNIFPLLVVPLFMLVVALEYYISLRKNKKVFKFESSITNVSIGIGERLINLFIIGINYSLFNWVYTNYAIFEIDNNFVTSILLLLLADFVWYWYHRLGHKVNLFWAAHIVHHHSNEFNYTAATRITTIQAMIRTPFWLVLVFLGFHPNQVLFVLVIHGAYSFFTHTQIFNFPKWLDKVFITPNLHGIHHASNEVYLDKNFGDVFVFWDKIFGTYQGYVEKPIYGITAPLNRSSFLWQHFHYYLELFVAIKKQKNIKNKIQILFGDPSLVDKDIRSEIEKVFFEDNSKKTINGRLKKYVTFQLILALSLLFFITYKFNLFTVFEKINYTAILIFTLVNIGALLEQKKWIYYLEFIRLFFVFLLIAYFYDAYTLIFVSLVVMLILSLNRNLKERYLNKFLNYDCYVR